MPSLKALHSHRASSPSQYFLADGRSAVWARSSTDDVSLSQLHKVDFKFQFNICLLKHLLSLSFVLQQEKLHNSLSG